MKKLVILTLTLLLSTQAFAGQKAKVVKNGEIYDLLHSACASLEMEVCPTLYRHYNIEAIAQAGVLKKSGKSIIIVNPSKFRSSAKTTSAKKAVIAHELSHVLVKEKTGNNSRHHGGDYKKECKSIVEALELSPTACKSSM